jgi:hypothetical protein
LVKQHTGGRRMTGKHRQGQIQPARTRLCEKPTHGSPFRAQPQAPVGIVSYQVGAPSRIPLRNQPSVDSRELLESLRGEWLQFASTNPERLLRCRGALQYIARSGFGYVSQSNSKAYQDIGQRKPSSVHIQQGWSIVEGALELHPIIFLETPMALALIESKP